ncbi:MAG TPA: MraY family glycosyltransferase [Prolixibacteraceae bacterium]|nr:MraY family glycosyltransferase [Prolixibacteraceae bacterium]
MIPIVQIILASIIAAFLVYITIPVVVRVSKVKNLFDYPDERKVNKTVVPNLGGISIFIGIMLATLLSLFDIIFLDFRYIMAGMIMLLFIGIKDDIMIMPARKKFIIQMICALILVVFGDIRFTNLHGVLGIYEINYAVSLLFSFLAIVAIINAVNLIDGIDGLAASLGILIASTFGLLFFSIHELPYTILCFAIAGSLIPFYFFNVYGKVNKIFMGDTGSLILGLLFAVFVIKYNEFAITKSNEFFRCSPALSMAIVAIPLFDMVRVFFFRIRRRMSPMSPDKNHIHHKLLRLGYSHLKSTLILVSTNLLLIGMVYLMDMVETNVNLQLFLLFTTAMMLSFVPDVIYQRKKALANSVKVQSNLAFKALMDAMKSDAEASRSSAKKSKYLEKTLVE